MPKPIIAALPPLPAPVHELILGYSPEAWTAFGTALLALITLGLVVAAIYQVRQVRAENKKIQTLTVCCGYDTSPVMYECLKKLREARDNGDLEANPKTYRTEIGLVLNYLDSIAIGIGQGLFLEALAWDHMEGIVKSHVKTYIDSGLVERCGHGPEFFLRLIDLRDQWSRARPRFHDGFVWWWKRKNDNARSSR